MSLRVAATISLTKKARQAITQASYYNRITVAWLASIFMSETKMFCHICYYCGNCKRKKNEESEWRYPQGSNDSESLSSWQAWTDGKAVTDFDKEVTVNYNQIKKLK